LHAVQRTGGSLPRPNVFISTSSSSQPEAAAAEETPPVFIASPAARGSVRIEAGRHVSAGDRFEVIRPGYQVVRDQMAEPRRDVPVLGLSLSGDRRTIIIRVPRQTEPVGYAVTLPLPESWVQPSPVAQKPEMDVLVTLNGIKAYIVDRKWADAAIVLPNAAVHASEKFTKGSSLHESFFRTVHELGKAQSRHWLGMDGLLYTADPFVPEVQPGATLDYGADYTPADVWWGSGGDIQIPTFSKPEGGKLKPMTTGHSIAFDLSNMEEAMIYAGRMGEPLAEPYLAQLPLPLESMLLPWAVKADAKQETPNRELPGNWLAGRRVFFSSEAACFTCHQIRGEGIAVGADLTNLIHRDRDSVLVDILQPSASINPDHPASMVKLKSGASLTGIVRTVTEQEVKVMLQMGAVQTLARADVESMELLKTSLMPEGYADRLTKEQQTDLLKFLLENPLEPAPIERTDPPPPPPRKRAEVDAILSQTSPTGQTSPAKPLKILLAAGPKDHGPGEHDYPLWQKRWTTLLRLADGVTVDNAWEFPKPEQLAAADVTVFFSKNPGFNPRTAMLLDEYQNRGGGLVYLHWAVNGDEHAQVLAERIGLAGGKFGVKYRHGEFDLVFKQPAHPVTQGFPTVHFTDETYWALQGDVNRINVLGTGVEEGEPRPQLWALERGQGRVIGCVPGHYTWTFDDPLYRLLVLRAICWTGKQEYVDRLSELATVGARIAP